VKDRFTGEIVGHAMGGRMTRGLTLSALAMTIGHRKPAPGLVHHSDRGSQ
jgi:putative transposase